MKGIIVINAFLKPEQSVRQAERLKQEFNERGVETEIVSDGFVRTGIFDGKIVSSFKSVDFAVYLDKDKFLSAEMESSGIRLFNRHFAIRVCDDKGETYLALVKNGIPVPDTIFAPLCYGGGEVKREVIEGIAEKLSLPLVVKECYGSMGKGVYLAETKKDLFSLSEKLVATPHMYQKYIGYKRGVDVRIIVIGGKYFAAMTRKNENDFRSNVAQGGTVKAITPSAEFIAVAEHCARSLGLDYCGVDILYGENDSPIVCEVNSNAFFEGMEKATGKNVAKAYVDYIIGEMNK